MQFNRDLDGCTVAAMRDLKIEKLSDEFGQYLIFIECACGHSRRCNPSTLAHIAGWGAVRADVVKRMRCSKCGEKRCTARTMREQKPRGLRDER